MKKVLIQDKTASLSDLAWIASAVQDDFEGKLEIETTDCLSKTNFEITKYNLIMAHIHPFGDCCVSYMLKAKENNIPILLIYHSGTVEKEELEAISDKFNIELKQRSLGVNAYSNIIRSLEDKF